MITEEERQSIIEEACEKTLLMIPEIIGKLMTDHVALAKINKKFYDDYPEFRERKDIVASIVELTDGEHPELKYEEVLKKAVPEIRRSISKVKDLDMVTAPLPNRDLSKVDLGEL